VREDLDCFLQSALIAPAQECDWSFISRPPSVNFIPPLYLGVFIGEKPQKEANGDQRVRRNIASLSETRQDDRDLNLNHSLAVLRGFAQFFQLTRFDDDRNYLAKIPP